MNEVEELIYGLKRWINKSIIYLDNRKAEDFFNDEKSFDATCYSILVISEIATTLKDKQEIKNKYNINFEELSRIYNKCLSGDNINLSYIYNLVSIGFPKILELLK